MSLIGLYDDATGELVLVRDSAGYEVSRETRGLKTKAVPAEWPDRARWDAPTRSFVIGEDPARIEADLVAGIKAEAERRRMLVLSPGGSKKSIYALKQAEVEAWNELGSTLATALASFLQLPAAKQRRRFRFAMADAAIRGETNPGAAIARFTAGADASNLEAARIEAIEQKGVAAVRVATTAAAKRAAFAAINWTWQPA